MFDETLAEVRVANRLPPPSPQPCDGWLHPPHPLTPIATLSQKAVGDAAGSEGRAAFNMARSQGIFGHMMTGTHCFGPTTDLGEEAQVFFPHCRVTVQVFIPSHHALLPPSTTPL